MQHYPAFDPILRDRALAPNGSASDLGLYGAIPESFTPAASVTLGSASEGQASMVAQNLALPSQSFSTTPSRLPDGAEDQAAVAGLGSAAAPAQPSAANAPPAATLDQPGINPAPVSVAQSSAPGVMISSQPASAQQAPPASELPPAPELEASRPAELIDAVDTVRASVATLSKALDELGDRLSTAPSLSGVAIAPEALDTVVAEAGQLVAQAGDQLGLASIVETAPNPVASLSATVAPAAAAVIDILPAAPAIPVGSTIADAASVAVPAATAAAIAPLGDQPLAGLDPEGGIKTLVSLVSASDAFDVRDGESETAGFAPALGPIGAADLLMAADLPDGLLGKKPPPGPLDILNDNDDDLGLGLGL